MLCLTIRLPAAFHSRRSRRLVLLVYVRLKTSNCVGPTLLFSNAWKTRTGKCIHQLPEPQARKPTRHPLDANMSKLFLVAVAPCARGAEPLPFGLGAGLGGVEAESRTTGGPNRAPVPGPSPCLRPSPVPFFWGSCLKVQFCPYRQSPFSHKRQSVRGIKGAVVVAAEYLELVTLRASSL